jgi:hypothetical protein
MDELQTALQTAFEDEGYDVVTVTENRGQIRVLLTDEDAKATELRRITNETVGEESVMALNVTREAVEGQPDQTTVVSFRHRPS